MKLYPILIAAALIATPARSMEEGMPKMRRIQAKRTFIVPNQEAGEELLKQRGYGDQEPMVRMMNLMMVGGSGYEGMDMAQMTADATNSKISGPATVPTPAEGQTATFDFDAKITPNPPTVGANILVIVIQRKNTTDPAMGLKIAAQVYMTSMDMGTEEPSVQEISPGRYQLKAVFSMAGPWAVKILLPEEGTKVLNFEVGASK